MLSTVATSVAAGLIVALIMSAGKRALRAVSRDRELATTAALAGTVVATPALLLFAAVLLTDPLRAVLRWLDHLVTTWQPAPENAERRAVVLSWIDNARDLPDAAFVAGLIVVLTSFVFASLDSATGRSRTWVQAVATVLVLVVGTVWTLVVTLLHVGLDRALVSVVDANERSKADGSGDYLLGGDSLALPWSTATTSAAAAVLFAASMAWLVVVFFVTSGRARRNVLSD